MKTLSLILIILPLLSWASPQQRPADFKTTVGMATFVDFTSATSVLAVNLGAQTVTQVTTIDLKQINPGHIIVNFDPMAASATLDGKPVQLLKVQPSGSTTTFKMVNLASTAGAHRLVIASPVSSGSLLSHGVSFKPSLEMKFSFVDLENPFVNPGYLNKYLPSNLEYDQYQMNMELQFLNKTISEVQVIANGQVVALKNNSVRVSFPAFYNTSSAFLHVVEKGAIDRLDHQYKSIDGRTIPVTLYALKADRQNLSSFQASIKQILTRLEAKFGPWPHSFLIVHANGMRNMEYVGATTTELKNLSHELLHSYFGRLAMPANGSAGWVDEAIVSWDDKGSKLLAQPEFESGKMGALGPYAQATVSEAYTDGASFMGYLANLFQKANLDFEAFLKAFATKYARTTYTSQDFQVEVIKVLGQSVRTDFDRYIFGKAGQKRR